MKWVKPGACLAMRSNALVARPMRLVRFSQIRSESCDREYSAFVLKSWWKCGMIWTP